jgi:hypothetical protein
MTEFKVTDASSLQAKAQKIPACDAYFQALARQWDAPDFERQEVMARLKSKEQRKVLRQVDKLRGRAKTRAA